MILLNSQTAVGQSQELDIDALELEAAQQRDAAIAPDFFVDTSLDELLADAVLQQAVHSAGLTPAEFRILLRDLATRILAARARRATAG